MKHLSLNVHTSRVMGGFDPSFPFGSIRKPGQDIVSWSIRKPGQDVIRRRPGPVSNRRFDRKPSIVRARRPDEFHILWYVMEKKSTGHDDQVPVRAPDHSYEFNVTRFL
jgi:hypothetical protein